MNKNDVQVRRTTSDDFNDVMQVETLAFGSAKEAEWVAEVLADANEPYLSLLALYKGEAGVRLVLVLGHKEYYPRHGFKGDAEGAGYFPPYPLPREYADYWMYQYLTLDVENIPKGRIGCTAALDKPQHWRE